MIDRRIFLLLLIFLITIGFLINAAFAKIRGADAGLDIGGGATGGGGPQQEGPGMFFGGAPWDTFTEPGFGLAKSDGPFIVTEPSVNLSGGNTGSTTTVNYVTINPVAPEPISSALFLLGGGTLALRIFRRKRT